MIIFIRKQYIILLSVLIILALTAVGFAQTAIKESKPLYRDISVIVDAGHEALGEYFK